MSVKSVARVAQRRARADGQPDGRHERTRRTRAAIVQALFELTEAGELEPTAQAIAERAGVAVRSIRQHFVSREQLFLAAAEVHARRSLAARPTVDLALAAPARVAAFAALRGRELESTRALRRAVGLVEHRSSIIAQAARQLGALRRREVAQSFARELATAPAAARRGLLDRLDAVSTGKLWDVLRGELGLSATAAERQLAELVGAILGV
ncbi:MAG: TetR family transcriptional regulator [Deltaproteobacteria bacterium]|nr:TetR family transcriptional regulator [Deltaproteobacteria bacterium]